MSLSFRNLEMNHQEDAKEVTSRVPPQVHQTHQGFHLSSSLYLTTKGKNPRTLSQVDKGLVDGVLVANGR